jgi:nucleoside-diphosphate-sugar epimerase
MDRKRVLITGVAGTIGQACVEHLSDRYELSGIDLEEVVTVRTYLADVGDLDAIQAEFAGMDAVVHLAANPLVSASWDDVHHINIQGTYNVYEACRMHGVPAVVFASSNHAIGGYEVDGAPEIYRLDDPRVYDHTVELRPDSLYGVSKVFGEAVGRFYADYHGVRSYNLRIGTVRADDDPQDPSVTESSFWLDISPEDKFDRMRATWLSKRDCAELIAACIEAEHVPFAIVYGISDNPRKFWDISHAEQLLGWKPIDSAPLGDRP